MRITIDLDDALLADAREFTGLSDISAIVKTALLALVQREAARTLSRLGGTEPDIKAPPRR
jgi:Arc/MetJ family transcription regulator